MGFRDFVRRLSGGARKSEDSTCSCEPQHHCKKRRSFRVHVIREKIPSYNPVTGGVGELVHKVNMNPAFSMEHKGYIAMLIGEAMFAVATAERNKMKEVFGHYIDNILAGYNEFPEQLAALREIFGMKDEN